MLEKITAVLCSVLIVEYTKAQPVVEDAGRHDLWIYILNMQTHICIFESSQLEESYVGILVALIWDSQQIPGKLLTFTPSYTAGWSC